MAERAIEKRGGYSGTKSAADVPVPKHLPPPAAHKVSSKQPQQQGDGTKPKSE